MFPTLVTSITLVAMTLHACLGCCWHHAHALGMACSGHSHDTCEAGHGHAADSHAQAETLSRHENRHQDRGSLPPLEQCEEGSCAYLSTSMVEVPAPENDSTTFDALPFGLAATPMLGQGRYDSGQRFVAAGGSLVNGSILDTTQVCLL